MQIHQPIPHGLLYSVAPQNFAQFRLSDQAKHDDFEWEEYESVYAEETLANNVIAFLKEITEA
jgi:hypothetical protein